MPARATSHKIPTPTVQGDDSWVVMKPITVEAFRSHQALVLQATKTQANTDEGRVMEAAIHKSLMEKFLEWNWVDNDGNPLPQPHNNVQVVELLTMDEINLLTGFVLLGGGEKKVPMTSTPTSTPKP